MSWLRSHVLLHIATLPQAMPGEKAEPEVAAHTAPITRKQRGMTAGVWLIFVFLIRLGSCGMMRSMVSMGLPASVYFQKDL